MKGDSIYFFNEEVKFLLKNKKVLRSWLTKVIDNEDNRIGNINIILCSDEFLYHLNQQYLHHNTLTDIITFDLSEETDWVEGDIYISLDRAKENAKKFHQTLNSELSRLMVHGLLHLMGYTDKTRVQKQMMTEKEDFYLSLRP